MPTAENTNSATSKSLETNRCFVPLPRDNEDPSSLFNAIIQFLFGIEPMRRYFFENASLGVAHSQMCHFFTEMVAYQKKGYSILTWSKGDVQLREKLLSEPAFEADPFQDAILGLNLVLGAVRKEANKTPGTGASVNPRTPREAWTHHRAAIDDTFIGFLLELMVNLKRKYISCGHQYNELVFTFYLTLQVLKDRQQMSPSNGEVESTLANCLDEWLAEVSQRVCSYKTSHHYYYLQSSEELTCDQCKLGPQKSNRRVDILRGPPYLLFQLVRFHQENGKERRPLIINETLSLATQSYQLCAAILHKGTAGAGHYLNLLKEATNQWVVLDDESVVVAVDDSLTHEMLKQWAYLVLYKAADLVRRIIDSQGTKFD